LSKTFDGSFVYDGKRSSYAMIRLKKALKAMGDHFHYWKFLACDYEMGSA